MLDTPLESDAEERAARQAVRTYLDWLGRERVSRRMTAGTARGLSLTESGRREADRIREAFVDAAEPYSRRRGISYTAWLEIGVPAGVLREAGIRSPRASRRR